MIEISVEEYDKRLEKVRKETAKQIFSSVKRLDNRSVSDYYVIHKEELKREEKKWVK
jgi:hypothetical protein